MVAGNTTVLGWGDPQARRPELGSAVSRTHAAGAPGQPLPALTQPNTRAEPESL